MQDQTEQNHHKDREQQGHNNNRQQAQTDDTQSHSGDEQLDHLHKSSSSKRRRKHHLGGASKLEKEHRQALEHDVLDDLPQEPEDGLEADTGPHNYETAVARESVMQILCFYSLL